MNIVEALLAEHGVLVALFDRLDRDLRDGQPVGEVREQAALLAAALVSHAHLEDEVLFARMAEAGAAADLLQTMEDEHTAIAAHLVRAQGTLVAADAADELRAALLMARSHFALEERMLFPMAAALLSEQVLGELGAVWAERRGVFVDERSVSRR